MTTTETEYGVQFRHTSDFAGPVIIIVRDEAISEGPDSGTSAVMVPFDALKSIVALWVRQELVRVIEDAEDDELLLETTVG